LRGHDHFPGNRCYACTLPEIDIEIAQLPGSLLGVASTSTNKLWLDGDAGGHGWSLEVGSAGYDLLSAVTHEQAHRLGMDDSLLGELLEGGTRRLPTSCGKTGLSHTAQADRAYSANISARADRMSF
jgi:hypothetical protein